MKLHERGLESVFFPTRATRDLVLFVRALMSISMEGEDWRRMRKQETLEAMFAERRERGGKTGVAQDILAMIGDNAVKFIPNKYPYDGLYPARSQLIHSCLWSREGSMTRSEIVEAIKNEYGDHRAVVFENAGKRKSIEQIWHVHAVVDMK